MPYRAFVSADADATERLAANLRFAREVHTCMAEFVSAIITDETLRRHPTVVKLIEDVDSLTRSY